VMSHESGRDFGVITMLFSVAPLSGVHLETSEVMLPKFHPDSWVISNPCFVSHPWVGLGPILSFPIYIHIWL
jgi:hypothetical protein